MCEPGPREAGRQRLTGRVAEDNLGTYFAVLMHTQVDEAGAREERLDLAKRAKRPSTPCSDPERKRFRFNSESG